MIFGQAERILSRMLPGFEEMGGLVQRAYAGRFASDELTPLAERLGNVNLVTRLADGRLRGDNTDYFGFARLLDSTCEAAGLGVPSKAAVLGAGGAATTAKTVLADRGADVVFVRRGELPPQDAELIVNATPVGMHPDDAGREIILARDAEQDSK